MPEEIKKSTQCSCILPVFNEGSRVLSVLRVLSSIISLNEIICVDDGSTDETSLLIKKYYPQVRLITLEKNMGKSAAIEKGLYAVQNPYVLFMDADLWNLNKDELERGIAYMFAHPAVDMLIFRRKYDPWFSKIFRGDLLVSGERMVKTMDLKKIFQEKFYAYQIEIAINFYMQDRGKTTCWMSYSGRNVMKFKKVGLLIGTMRELQYYISVIRYKGLIRYFRNMLLFCHEEVF